MRAYDPVAIPDAKLELNGTVQYCDSAYAACEGVDALVVGTGWPEFRGLDFDRIKHLLKRPLIVDTKNLLDFNPPARHGIRVRRRGPRVVHHGYTEPRRKNTSNLKFFRCGLSVSRRVAWPCTRTVSLSHCYNRRVRWE